MKRGRCRSYRISSDTICLIDFELSSSQAEKNNDIMKFAGKWMELENVILSEMILPYVVCFLPSHIMDVLIQI
ncbi:hypothetical protein STEG23_001690 [Scotinomys teguina]